MARNEAERLRHEYVGTEHLLLGLLHDGVIISVLTSLGADAHALRGGVEKSVRIGDERRVGPDFPYSSPAKRVLELAFKEARELNHAYVGTEHLLLGLLREEKGIAASVLRQAGVALEAARTEVVRLVGESQLKGIAESRGSVGGSGWFVSISGSHVQIFGLIAIALVAWLVSGPAVLVAILGSLPPLLLARRYGSFFAAKFSLVLGVIAGSLVGSLLFGSGSLGTRLLAALLATLAVGPPVGVLFWLRWDWAHRFPAAAA